MGNVLKDIRFVTMAKIIIPLFLVCAVVIFISFYGYNSAISEEFRALEDAIERYSVVIEDDLITAFSSAESRANTLFILLLSVIGISVAIALTSLFLIVYKLAPMPRVVSIADELSNGNVDEGILSIPNDELGSLTKELVFWMKSFRDANERTTLMLNTSPLCAHILDEHFNIIDCNESAVTLYGFKNKQEYMDRFLVDCIPEYQPDGQRSDEKRRQSFIQAFDESYHATNMTYKMPDSDIPIPSEVTLVRTNYHDSDVLVAYTKDLRDINQMERQIRSLKDENKKVFYDALTGIYNRRFYDEAVQRMINSLSRSSSLLSLMMIDIDYFKKYNDTYGHSAGDDCLKIVADILTKNVRPDDFIARYGGEEFVAVLPNTDEAGAHTVAERLLQSIRERAIPHEASEVAVFVTISIGITTGIVQSTHSADDFVKQADMMLYKSKQEGRNRYNSARFENDTAQKHNKE